MINWTTLKLRISVKVKRQSTQLETIFIIHPLIPNNGLESKCRKDCSGKQKADDSSFKNE